MKQVWIVNHDGGPDNTILGVFDDDEEAYAYQVEITAGYPGGALLPPPRSLAQH